MDESVSISCEQPIECVFADMSERLMRIQRDLLMPAFIMEQEGIQNTITMFGSARIKPEAVALENLEAAKKRANTKEGRENLERAKMAYEMSNITLLPKSWRAEFKSGAIVWKFQATRNIIL